MASRKKNPKKNPAARRRRPERPGLRRAQLRLEDIDRLLSGATAEALPLMALPAMWLWNMAQDGHAAAHCVDACLVLKFALAEYGVSSDIEAVGVQVNADEPGELYDHAPFYNSDGTFNGHTILVVPPAGRMIDPTVQQFSEVPQTARATLPLVAPLPAGDGLGEEPFGVARMEYTVAYRPYPEPDRHGWRSPVIDARIAEFRQAGANLAGNAFDVMRLPAFQARTRQSPYPRLRSLLAQLDGAETVVEGGRYMFADPVTGVRRVLADVP